MSRISDEYIYCTNMLHSRLYIDVHLCRGECGVFENKDLTTGKGIVYLAIFDLPEINYVFLQAEGYQTTRGYVAEKCNQCDGTVELLRIFSKFQDRKCRDCDDTFTIETVSYSTHSFTVVNKKLLRDRFFYQCPKHFGMQDGDMLFI